MNYASLSAALATTWLASPGTAATFATPDQRTCHSAVDFPYGSLDPVRARLLEQGVDVLPSLDQALREGRPLRPQGLRRTFGHDPAGQAREARVMAKRWNRGWKYCPPGTKYQGRVVMYDLRFCDGPIKDKRPRQ